VTPTFAPLSAVTDVSTSPRGGAPEAGIVHLGLGNFHRAHQAVYTARAIEQAGGAWGIVGVAHTNPRVVQALQRQGGRYTVLELGADGSRASVMGVHAELLVGADDPAAVAAWIADPRVRVITVTVTEQGYTFDPLSRRLDVRNPALVSDLAGGAPRTMIGQLSAGLRRRYAAGAAPLTVVSCDNITANGKLTHGLLLEYLDRQTGGVRAEMRDWVAQDVTFPSTMVDRIVPRTADHHRDAAARILGVRDEAVVPAEPYSMWVVEDRFAGDRPAWELAGARIGDEVELYERLKAGLLNASHSLVAYLGLLGGAATIAEAVAVPAIRESAEYLMEVDISPTLEPPVGVDPHTYGREVLGRFANPHTGHRVRQVASDGATKLPQRIGGPCRSRLVQGALPTGIALLLAAYLRTMSSGEVDLVTDSTPLVDPERTAVGAALADGRSIRQVADAVLARTAIVPQDVPRRDGLLDLIAHLYEALVRGGVPVAVREALAEGRNAG
jgi:fructuronate reductase